MLLFGAGGHCKVILDILFSEGRDVDYVVDDHPASDRILGVPVQKNNLDESCSKTAIISIGNNEIRRKITRRYPLLDYRNATHPTAIVSRFAQIGIGTVVMAGAIVNPHAEIGEHCIINTSAVVEHDCSLGDFVHISPNAALAGNVQIGPGTHVGVGAVIIPGIKVGQWCVIGAGAVLIKDVPDFSVVVGNPGKIIKINQLEYEL